MKTNRRNFVKKIGIGASGIVFGHSINSNASPLNLRKNKKETEGQILYIGDDIAVVETIYGKVQGYILRGIYYFLGIPYGADTSGSKRFMPPTPPKPWDNTYQAIWWGDSAPQNMENKYANFFNGFLSHLNYSDLSEDCLRINVFTPGINDRRKRPVLLWIHGGGFTTGNGIEQDEYNGENLARFGDVVFCSVNHRLGPLGFTNLNGVGGDRFAASGNVGMLDLVAALEWIRDNISNFGGDPNNVTIMGQSGGGAKVTTLTAMPSAKGLFHKAVVLSGAGLRSGEKEYSEKLGKRVLKEARLTENELDKLQYIPWLEYIHIANNAAEKLFLETGPSQEWFRRGFSPVVDGYYLPSHPYYPEATPLAENVPMLICSTLNESIMLEPELELLTFDDVKERLKPRFGKMSGKIVDVYARTFPGKNPADILSIIISNYFRQPSVELANIKSKQNAPVYLAWFWWQPPLFNNRLRAFHCIDISFWFHNTDLMFTHTGGGERPRNLSEKMAGTLIQFMKNGDPNGAGLPHWPRYTADNGETMILDDRSEIRNDPDREARNLMSST